MTTIQLTFPWGHFYATPWGINASRLREPEWPPSPWRLLRALVSAWFRAHPGQVPGADCVALIESLARDLPDIGVGKVSFGHTVHWQPNYGAADKDDKAEAAYKNTRHENHFAAVSGPVFFRWQNVTLTSEHRHLLETLLAELTYFGRAESLCHAELCNTEPPEDGIGWCKPTDGRKIASSCRDVFCPKPGKDDNDKWNFQFTDLWSRRADGFAPDYPDAPPHLVDKLLSTDMKADGAEWRSYQMPDGWPQKWVVRTPRTAKAHAKPSPTTGHKIAHYLCFSLQCRVPIAPKFIVPISEKFREALGSHFGKSYPDADPSFALFGHGRPDDARGDHQHAFYLPMAARDDPKGGLKDLHIWCPYGFTQAEVEILMCLKTLYWGSGRYPVRAVLTALSKTPPDDAPFATGQTAATVWRSASPFVPPRYFYRSNGKKLQVKAKDAPDLQLVECLKAAGAVDDPICIRAYIPTDGNGAFWDIVRAEIGEQTAAGAPLVTVPTHRNCSSVQRRMEQRIGAFYRVEFSSPVKLNQPAIGHSCHFGLGLFVPAD